MTRKRTRTLPKSSRIELAHGPSEAAKKASKKNDNGARLGLDERLRMPGGDAHGVFVTRRAVWVFDGYDCLDPDRCE